MWLFRWIENLTTLTSIIITLGISIAAQSTLLPVFGPTGQRLKQVAGTLSGGEQQMLAIARGLMARPKVSC